MADEEPPIRAGDEFYLAAFDSLCTERRFAGGPIPRSAVEDYAVRIGLDEDMRPIFAAVMRALDSAYAEFFAQKGAKGAEPAATPTPQPGQRVKFARRQR